MTLIPARALAQPGFCSASLRDLKRAQGRKARRRGLQCTHEEETGETRHHRVKRGRRYAAQIEPADRWAIAAYIRALQYSRNGSIADVPSNQRGGLPDASEITIEGVPLAEALSSGGKGSSEEISPAGANPIPAMNKEIGGAARPQPQAPPKQEGTEKK